MQEDIKLKKEINSLLSSIVLDNQLELKNLLNPIIITKEKNVGIIINLPSDFSVDQEKTSKLVKSKLATVIDINQIFISYTKDKKTEKTRLAKKVIAVISGKGGVGKSTISACLAQQLAKIYAVGLVDADIYGPSMHKIFNLKEGHDITNNKIDPFFSHNTYIVSMGCLVKDASKALAWRGPMATKALYQILSLSNWPELDYLIIDMPPGTGDIHMSLLSKYYIDSIVVITTPQELAMIDVIKSMDLYKFYNVKISAVIENMSYYEESGGNIVKIFNGNAGEGLAKLAESNLVKIPVDPQIAEYCDKGDNISDLLPDLSKFVLVHNC